MRLREEEISDLVWLGRRIDKILLFFAKEDPKFRSILIDIINSLFVPIILEDLNEDEENYLFERMDDILDKIEERFPEAN
jgi:hypothetical protein